MAESPNDGSHVLMLPYLAKGHLIPFSALARTLSDRTSYKITLISTPLNVQILRSLLPPETPNIDFAELPFCSTDHGLPPGVENTGAAPPHLVRHLLQASGSLRPAFEQLVGDITRREGRPPLCVISDAFMAWTLEIARRFEFQNYTFSIHGAYGSIGYVEMAETSLGSDESPLRRAIAYVLKQFSFSKESDGLLLNTVEELEAEALEIYKRKYWKKVWAIGPVLSSPPSSSSSPVLDWLDQHPKSSVLYVAFGSEIGTHSHQMIEIAEGLEASGKSFIWVIRPPIGFDMEDDDDFSSVEWLPEGFQERVTKEKNQGLLVKKWAPQFEILSHQAIAAFFTHCGWNSALETLSKGVPVIGWPLAYECPWNSRFLEEKLGVAVEVAEGWMRRFVGRKWRGSSDW